MHEDLREALHRESRVAQAHSARPDLNSVKRGGLRLLWSRRIGIVGTVVLVIAGGSLILSQFLDPTRSEQPVAGVGEAATAQVPETSDGRMLSPDNVPSWRVVTFAARAVAQAGLSDTNGLRLVYRDHLRNETGWAVRFASAKCEDDSNCVPGDPVRFPVRTSGTVLEVSEEAISGLSPETIGRLTAYREVLTSELTSLEFLAPTLTESPDEGLGISTSELWTGPLPDSGSEMSVTCRVEVFDRAGESIYIGKPLEMLVPSDEKSRTDDGTHLFGVSAELAQVVPADLTQADSADVLCGEAHDVSEAPKGSRRTWGLPYRDRG
jgi:hypothetical protein